MAGLLAGCQARLDRAYDDWEKRCEEAWHQQRLENIEKEKEEKRRAAILENSRRAEAEESRRRNEKKERLRREQEEENRRRVEKEEFSRSKLQKELMRKEAEAIQQHRLEEKREQREEDRRKLKRREERLKVPNDLLQRDEASNNHHGLEVQQEYNKRLSKDNERKQNEVLSLQVKKSGVQRKNENALPLTNNVSSPPKISTKRRRIFGNIDKEVENGKKKRDDCWNESSNTLETASISVRVPLRAEKSLKKNSSSLVSLPEVRNNDANLKGKYKAEMDPANDKNMLSDIQRPAQSKRALEARNVLKGKKSFPIEDKRQEDHSYRLKGKTTAQLATSKYYSASASCNSSYNLTGDAAPLVQAALTAASQENDRISQTSTNTRSRYKNGHPQKQKKLDIFACSDGSFLDISPTLAPVKTNKTKENIGKTSQIQKSNDTRKNILHSMDAAKSRGADRPKCALATSQPLSEKQDVAHSNGLSNIRARRKKSSCRGASKNAFETDVGFM